jgi:two-component system, sensor histidine kinase and response regulator
MISMEALPKFNRILIIEDDMMQAQILKAGLTRAGFAVDVVSSGLAAVARIETTHFDVVLVDYSIPEMDGLAVARVVGDVLGPMARPVLIALTSAPDNISIRESGSTSAFDLILDKSHGLEDLIGTINHCIAADLRRNNKKIVRDSIYAQLEDDVTFGPRSHSENREQLNILVVEDNELQQSLLTDILKRRGYAVEATSDGLQAIRSMREKYFDLAVVDYRIPNIDGVAVASLVLDQMSEAWRPRLIAYTASPDLLRDRISPVGAIFDEIVDKSSTVDNLLGTISRLLQTSPNATTRRLASVSV